MNVPRSALGCGGHDDRLLALWGGVLMGSTNAPKVAISTDIPATDSLHASGELVAQGVAVVRGTGAYGVGVRSARPNRRA
ncbi:hypothetical protein GCM10023086_08300 [Streptomyces venetus]|uniref:Uncharacterized protein n=1 Tax=Streptomyces venetus TaxID=1701086 RepID=A0ABP8F552_9ACTN